MTVLPPPLTPPTEEGVFPWHKAACIALDAFIDVRRTMTSYSLHSVYSGPAIIQTAADQVPNTINPMWDVVRRLPTFADTGQPVEGSTPGLTEFGEWRWELGSRFAYCIPTPGDLAWIKAVLDGRPLIEVGSGLGYWAWQLRQLGVTVTATDINPQPESVTFVPVEFGAADTVAAGTADAALMVMWPPMNDPMALDAITAYPGDRVIVCAEYRRDPCTANNAFLAALRRHWRPIGISPAHVDWSIFTDVNLIAFERA